MNGFLPPVIFEIQANAAGAIASFRKVNTELSVMEAKALKAGKALTGFQKAATIGTKALKVMGIALVAFAAYGIREMVKLEKSFTRLGQAMANAGVATEANLEATSKLMDSMGKLGIGADVAADAYAVLITSTQDIEKSNRMLALSADLARARTMGLEEAARALSRAQAGNARIFTQFGITLDNTKPKAEAIEEAMAKLEQRLSGQALAYTKTFAGQLAVLTENLDALAEQIGMKVLPILNKFVGGLIKSGEWVRKNQDFVIALGIAITVALIPAVVNLTKKMALLTLAILKSPIGRLVAIVFAVSYAFVKAYNSSEDFRKKMASVGKFVLTVVGYMVGALESLIKPLSLAGGAGLKLRKVFAEIRGDSAGAAKAAQEIRDWETEHAKIGDWTKAIEKAKDSVDDFAEKKLSITWDFKIPKIPGFENGLGGGTDGGIKSLSESAVSALQKIKDYNMSLAATFKSLKEAYTGIVSTDFGAAIKEGLLNPVDKLIVKAQKSIDVFQEASNGYSSALAKVTAAQKAYSAAAEGTNKALQGSTASALKRAEDVLNKITTDMEKSLSEISQFQTDAINFIIDAYNQIDELRTTRKATLQKDLEDRLQSETDYLDKVAQLTFDNNARVLAAKQDAAKREAEVVKTSVDQLRNIYKSATARSIGDIYSGLTFSGRYLQGGTTNALVDSLKKQLDTAKEMADNASKLGGLGFSQTFIEQVVAQGPEIGGALAKQILNSTPESITQLRTYWQALEDQTSNGVDALAHSLNSGMVLATEELTNQLKQIGLDLNTQLAAYAADLTNSTAVAYSEYQKTLDAIKKTTKATTDDIDAQITLLQGKIAQMQTALAQVPGISAPGTQQKPVDLTPIVPIPTADEALADSERALKEAEAAVAEADARSAEIEAFIRSLTATQARPTSTPASNFTYGSGNPLNVTINAVTNASSQSIASDVAWAIKTSGDQQYAINPRTNKAIPLA